MQWYVGIYRDEKGLTAAIEEIEELKRRVPIWKREHYTDGTREWVDPSGHASVGSAP